MLSVNVTLCLIELCENNVKQFQFKLIILYSITVHFYSLRMEKNHVFIIIIWMRENRYHSVTAFSIDMSTPRLSVATTCV